jgi:hypothetical protein
VLLCASSSSSTNKRVPAQIRHRWLRRITPLTSPKCPLLTSLDTCRAQQLICSRQPGFADGQRPRPIQARLLGASLDARHERAITPRACPPPKPLVMRPAGGAVWRSLFGQAESARGVCEGLHEKPAAVLIVGPQHRDHRQVRIRLRSPRTTASWLQLQRSAGLRSQQPRRAPLDPFISLERLAPRRCLPYMAKELQAPINCQCRLFTGSFG